MNSAMQYRFVLGGAAILFLLAGLAAWLRPADGPWPALALAAGGVGALALFALARTRAALRKVFQQAEELKQADAELKRENAELRARLALAERRLAALAIALDLSDELDEPGGGG